MLNAPPDPAASLEAEERADDDGMPEHPLKAADPAAWADDHVAREKTVAAGYPTSKVGQAWADLVHSASRVIDRVRPSKPVTISAASVAGIGVGLAVYMLFMRNNRYRYR